MIPQSKSNITIEETEEPDLDRLFKFYQLELEGLLVRLIDNSEQFTNWGLPSGDESRLIRLLSARKNLIITSFRFRLKKLGLVINSPPDSLYNSASNVLTNRYQRQDRQSLAETQELESIVLTIEPIFSDINLSIESRLNEIHGFETVYSPFDITLLLDAYRYSIDSLSLDIPYKLALYRLFTEQYLMLLGPLVRTVEQYINPVIDSNGLKRKAINWRGSIESSSIQAISDTKISNQLETLQILHNIWDQNKHQSNPDEPILDLIRDRLNQSSISTYNDTIQYLNFIFNFIFEDNDISQVLKHLIARLQIPIMILIMPDYQVLKQSSHPVRLFFDMVIRRQQVISNQPDLSKIEFDFLGEQINKLIETRPFTDDSIRSLVNNYQAYIEHSDSIKTKMSELEEHQNAITKFIREVTLPLRLLRRPRILFDHVWIPLLRQVASEDGADSDRWKRTTAMIKTQVWSVIPKSSSADLSRLEKNIPTCSRFLLRAVKRLELSEKNQASLIQYQQFEHRDVVAKSKENIVLKNAVHQAEQPSFIDTLQIVRETRKIVAPRAGLPKTVPITKVTVPVSKGIMSEQSIANFNKDDWFFLLENNGKQPIKLIWKAVDSSLFIFVNQAGQRVLEISGKDLMSKIENHSIEIANIDSSHSNRKAHSVLRYLD
jgi:hypothetical protein